MNNHNPIDHSFHSTTNPHPRSLVEHFNTRLSEAADSIVAEKQGSKLTMRKLANGSAYISDALLAQNVGPSDIIGIYAYPGFELLTGVWGVLRARGLLPTLAGLPRRPRTLHDRTIKNAHRHM